MFVPAAADRSGSRRTERRKIVRRTLGALSVGVLAVALAATGCSKTTGSTGTSGKGPTAQSGGVGTTAESKGPAKSVSGAVKGGKILVTSQQDFEHIDPQRVYVTDGQEVNGLITRSLTGYIDNGSGKLLVVGDLATNPGDDVNKDCKTWKYTLKSGLKYEDGSAITAADVAYGIARSFSPDLTDGPTYLQQWLADDANYNASYKGPYDGAALVPPGVTVNSPTELTFNFKSPHCDLPYQLTEGTSVPVPKAKDTKTNYDNRVFSSGPYKIQTYNRGSSMVLVRNQYWDASSDPIRNAYPDEYDFQLTVTLEAATQRLLADKGEDQQSVSFNRVDPAAVQQVVGNAANEKRLIQATSQFVWYLDINNTRITDVKERQAINYAIDKAGILQVEGGATAGTPTGSMLSPTTVGYQKYDAYASTGNSGDVAKAKQLLGGKHPKLTYAYGNTPTGAKVAQKIKSSLERAGFQVTTSPIDPAQRYIIFGTKGNPYDIYIYGWGSDWPSGLTVIPPMFDGRQIQPKGNQDDSYFNNADVNKKIDAATKETDPAKAAQMWASLDKEIMTKYAPVAPLYTDTFTQLYGSKVGNAYLSAAFGLPHLWNLYVKQ
jgi:peptide/nickel transport system substrate-binding protein